MPTSDQLAAPALDLTHIRSQFPSLSQKINGRPAVFLDGPGGTQVPQRVIDAISKYLRHDNANTGGAYATSRHTDAMIAEARAAMADFLHCTADEVVFGPNMTTLTFAMSRAIGRELKPGDEIVTGTFHVLRDLKDNALVKRDTSPIVPPKESDSSGS